MLPLAQCEDELALRFSKDTDSLVEHLADLDTETQGTCAEARSTPRLVYPGNAGTDTYLR